MAVTADCVQFLSLSKNGKPTAETASWILSSGRRLHMLIDTVEKKNKPEVCFAILDQLHRHDKKGSVEYYNLMFAISVVMDRPSRFKMHGQMGGNLLPVEKDPIKVYDYFKTLYSGKEALMDYKKLSPAELVFIVVPAPLSELEWARKNVKGSLSSWGEKYSDIDYDHARLNGSRFSWIR